MERRVRRQLAEQQLVVARGARAPQSTDSWGERFGFGVVSLVLAMPLSGIGGGVAGLPGLLVTWIGIVAVNGAWAFRNGAWAFRNGSWTGPRATKKSADDGWDE